MNIEFAGTQKELSRLPPRLALGSSMLFHGVSKLKAGPKQVGAGFEKMGIKPGNVWGMATGASETFAGVTTLLGIGTRISALAILITQSVAIAKVHAKHGYEVAKGGYEYNLTLIAIAVGLLVAGPGRLSLHELLENAARGHGAKRVFSRARPSLLVRLLKLIK